MCYQDRHDCDGFCFAVLPNDVIGLDFSELFWYNRNTCNNNKYRKASIVQNRPDDVSRRKDISHNTIRRFCGMKELDRVKLIKDRADYAERGVHKGDAGTIMIGERNGYVLVFFDGEKYQDHGYTLTSDIDVAVRVEDLEVIDE